ncbi:cysteine hydrolase [Candidatus Woesearchaeota archaeon]|nr:cysteine hydrolase [Candidatus Woesearchaeota archaeon]
MNQEIVYADRTALIVIDMQYEFVHQNGAIYVKQAEEQIPLISDLINYCRTKGIFIIYTKVIWNDDSEVPKSLLKGMPFKFEANKKILRRYLDSKPNLMVEIHEELKPKDLDYLVGKKYFDAFYNTNLDATLDKISKKNGKTIENLIFTGTTINNCVYSTMLGASHRNYKTIAIKDCISGFPGEDLDFWFNRQMPNFLGTVVLTAEELKTKIK